MCRAQKHLQISKKNGQKSLIDNWQKRNLYDQQTYKTVHYISYPLVIMEMQIKTIIQYRFIHLAKNQNPDNINHWKGYRSTRCSLLVRVQIGIIVLENIEHFWKKLCIYIYCDSAIPLPGIQYSSFTCTTEDTYKDVHISAI